VRVLQPPGGIVHPHELPEQRVTPVRQGPAQRPKPNHPSAGSKYHRPAEHTHSLTGRTLQSLQLSVAAGGTAGSEPAGGGVVRRTSAGEELLEDEHDEFCYVCGLGVSVSLWRFTDIFLNWADGLTCSCCESYP